MTTFTQKHDDADRWSIEQLRAHILSAMNLELWTIPFYMTSMYSIKDASTEAYGAILSVVNQEMLHLQLAANIANAFGAEVRNRQPIYYKHHIPHLDFDLDNPDPRERFGEYSAELGPFDPLRLNAMCLIEWPLWIGMEKKKWYRNYFEYGSVGEFYEAVSLGAEQWKDSIRPVRQVDLLARFYNGFHDMTVTKIGAAGFPQVTSMIAAITGQGEGRLDDGESWRTHKVPAAYRNTADDTDPQWSHFQKFITLLAADHFPETYMGETDPKPSTLGHAAQRLLEDNFERFLKTLDELFSGGHPAEFATHMFTLGGNILNCWKNGAVPKFGPAYTAVRAAAAGARGVFPAPERIEAGVRPIKRAAA
jgi:hypothetical protein